MKTKRLNCKKFNIEKLEDILVFEISRGKGRYFRYFNEKGEVAWYDGYYIKAKFNDNFYVQTKVDVFIPELNENININITEVERLKIFLERYRVES